MVQPGKWWWGLPPLVVLWGAATLVNVGPLEQDLAARGRQSLSDIELDRPDVVFTGRDGRITAAAFGLEARRDALESVATTFGVRLVQDATSLVPLVKPYVFTASRDGTTLVLSGAAPSPAARRRLLDAAHDATPDLKVIDSLTYGLGSANNFGQRALDVLSEAAGLASGSVSLSDATLSLEGTTASAEDYVRTMADLDALPDGLALGKVSVLPPAVKDFGFSVTKAPGRLTLSGFVPSIAGRAAVLDAARKAFPGTEIIDELDYAGNAPASQEEVARFAFKALGPLMDGEGQLKGGRFTFKGTAASRAAADAVTSAFTGLKFKGIAVAEPAVAAPPVAVAPAPNAPPAPPTATTPAASTENAASVTTPSATTPATTPPTAVAAAPVTAPASTAVTAAPVGGPVFVAMRDSAGSVTLSGVYPDEKTHQDILAAARRNFALDRLVDGMTLAEGAPKNLSDAARAALLRLSRLADGKVEITDRHIRLEGEARYAKAAEQVKASLSGGLPDGFTADGQIEVAKPADPVDAKTCQGLFTDFLSRGSILFEASKATISPDSLGLLDLIAATAQRCPASRIEVDGHTDKDGTADGNVALSRERAQAVVAWLADAGVDAKRLSAVGFGGTKPVASNDTEEGKAKNRRIEFTVK